MFLNSKQWQLHLQKNLYSIKSAQCLPFDGNRQISDYIDTREIMEVSEQSATLHIGNVSIDIYSGMDTELLKTLLEAVKLCLATSQELTRSSSPAGTRI